MRSEAYRNYKNKYESFYSSSTTAYGTPTDAEKAQWDATSMSNSQWIIASSGRGYETKLIATYVSCSDDGSNATFKGWVKVFVPAGQGGDASVDFSLSRTSKAFAIDGEILGIGVGVGKRLNSSNTSTLHITSNGIRSTNETGSGGNIRIGPFGYEKIGNNKNFDVSIFHFENNNLVSFRLFSFDISYGVGSNNISLDINVNKVSQYFVPVIIENSKVPGGINPFFNVLYH